MLIFMRKSSVQIVVRKNRPTPFTVKFREMGQRKTLAFKTRSEAEIFANTLERSKRLPDDVMLNSSDLMAFMRLKSACEAGGVSLEAGVEKAISSLITPNDYINGGLSLAAELNKFKSIGKPDKIDIYQAQRILKCSNRTVHTLRKLYPEIVSGGEHSHKYDRSAVERVAQIRSERYLR